MTTTTGLSSVVSTHTAPAPPRDGTVSIGVAIPLPARIARVVRRARTRTGDPQAKAIPPHVTLLPPTQVPSRAMPRIRHHLVAAAGHLPTFQIRLAGTGTFRPVSNVVFLQVVEGGSSCDQLQQLINRGILHRPLQFDYHPHVTLGHDVPDERLDEVSERMSRYQAVFTVTRFGLYRFGSDSCWQMDTAVDLASTEMIAYGR